MYYILHITTGHYVLDSDRTPHEYSSIPLAERAIRSWIASKKWCDPWEPYKRWNAYNTDIGYGLVESEFEIIEVK